MANSAKDKLDSTPERKLGHDISGPVTSILINCELLLEEECSEPVRRRAEIILAEAMRINHRLRQSRVEAAA